MKGKWPVLICLCYHRQWGTEHQYFTQVFSWRLHVTITYNLAYLRLWYVNVVTVIAWTPEVVCLTFQTSRHEKDGTWSNLTWFETTVLNYYLVVNSFEWILKYCRKSEWVIVAQTPNERFFGDSMARTSYFWWHDDDVCFVLDQHA